MLMDENIDKRMRNSMLHSMIYYAYMFRYISDDVVNYPYGSKLTALDVGPGYGLGTNLLGMLFSGAAYNIEIDTIDISKSYKGVVDKQPYIHKSYYGDIFLTAFEKKYDYIICSHVVEHMKDPYQFKKRLCEIGKQVFIFAPWKENPEKLTAGHEYIFDENAIEKIKDMLDVGAKRFELLSCMNWGQFMNPRYKCFFLQLEGKMSN